MSTSAAVLGGTISSNIVTPILRNRFASKRQSMPSRFDNTFNRKQQNIRPNTAFEAFRETSMSI